MPKALRVNDFSGHGRLTLDDVRLGAPGPGEVRIRVQAFALNRGEIVDAIMVSADLVRLF